MEIVQSPVEIYDQGIDAWENAGTDACNPYAEGTVEHRHWQRGFDHARRVELGEEQA